MSTMTPTKERVIARERYEEHHLPPRRPASLVSWSGILSGAAVGLATLFVLQSFWFALGFGSDISFWADNILWWNFASFLIAASVGGFVAGYAAGRRDMIGGLLSGLTVWGLVLFAASTFDVPSAIQQLVGGAQGANRLGVDSATWEAFFSIFGGFVLTGIFGVLGAMAVAKRPRAVYDYEDDDRRREADIDIR